MMIRCNYKLGYLKIRLVEDFVVKVTHLGFVTLVRDYPSHVKISSTMLADLLFYFIFFSFVLKAMRASVLNDVQLQGAISAPQGSTMVKQSSVLITITLCRALPRSLRPVILVHNYRGDLISLSSYETHTSTVYTTRGPA